MKNEDITTIAKIAERGFKVLTDGGVTVTRLEIMMDLEFCDEDVALDFDKLLAFGDGDFGHDITGIFSNFNRETKRLENCFVPRCSFPEEPDPEACTNPGGHEWNRSAGEADEARIRGDYANDSIRCIHCDADGDA